MSVSVSIAVSMSAFMFATVLLAITLLPTAPQAAPSGRRKSFCGSVKSSAVRPFSNSNPGTGAKILDGRTDDVKIFDRALTPSEIVSEMNSTVLPFDSLRWVSFSHWEGDESGALNEVLAAAPQAEAACGVLACNLSVDDVADRPARSLLDGEELSLGKHTVRWLATPHLPHGWECGHLFETTTRTLLCGDLFTQSGAEHPATTEEDVVGPSEVMRRQFDYYAHHPDTADLLEKLARTEPTTLACMHGPSYRGDGAAMLRRLAAFLEAERLGAKEGAG